MRAVNNIKPIYIILFFFGILFSSVSLVNHFLFRTYAWDLGINNNAIYDYAHFRWNDCMLMQPQFTNVLSDHFSLIPLLVSPLYWIFGTYTMLLIQIAGILFGGYGVFVYFSERTKTKWIPELAAIHFFSVWGIYSVLAFDYHDNVMAAMLVPWFLHFFGIQKMKKAFLFFLLILVSKENMALWAGFICIGLMLLNIRNKKQLVASGIFSAMAFAYFFGVVKIIIPALSNEGREYLHFHYSALGNNFSEAVTIILTHPFQVLKLLFVNHIGEEFADGIKTELHYMVLLSGGFALLFKPQYLIMLIPIYAQKLFNDDFGKWGLNYQYSIEFAPILTVALFSFITGIKKEKIQKILAVVSVVITIISTGWKLDSRESKWYSPEQVRFYQKAHYQRNFDVQELYNALKLIPENAKVSAQSFIVPHLAFRDYIYQFPVVQDAEYIVFMKEESPYPLNEEEFEGAVKKYSVSEEWESIYNCNFTFIFKRKI